MTELREQLDEWIKAQHFEDTPETEHKIKVKADELFKQYIEDNNMQYDEEVYRAYATNLLLDLVDVEDWADDADDCYEGEFYSDAEFAEQLLDATGDTSSLPDIFQNHIDWDGVAYEVMFDYFEEEGHYFRSV